MSTKVPEVPASFWIGFCFFFSPLSVLTCPPQLHGIQSCLLLSWWSQDVGLHLPSRLSESFPQLQVSPSVARTGPMTSRLEILLPQTERAPVIEGNRTGIQIRGTSTPFPRCRGGEKSENKYTSWLKSKAKKTTRKSAPGWLKPPLWWTGGTHS